MKRKSIIIVEPDQALRDKIVGIAKKIDPNVIIGEFSNGQEALEMIPLRVYDILFANLTIPQGDTLFAAIENPYYKFARPLHYTIYAENFDVENYHIPKLEKLTLMKLPIDDAALTEYITKRIAIQDKPQEQKKESYMKIPMETVIKFGKAFPFDIFIKIGDKILKLSSKDDDRQEQFKKYHEKGLNFVFVVKERYVEYLDSLKKNMTSKFADPNSVAPTEDVVETLDGAHRALKAVFDDGFVPKESIELAKTVASNSLQVIEKTPNIFQFFMEFKEKCNQQFMISMITGYLTTCMLDQFDWATSSIKEKMTLAGMLCDVILDNNDIVDIKKKSDDPSKLSQKILDHPTTMVEMLKPNIETLSKEILIIIREHHEKPDGSGYPMGIDYKKVNTLSAIFIVGHDFVNSLVAKNFNYSEIGTILREFAEKYSAGNFRKAYKSLHEVFSPS